MCLLTVYVAGLGVVRASYTYLHGHSLVHFKVARICTPYQTVLLDVGNTYVSNATMLLVDRIKPLPPDR